MALFVTFVLFFIYFGFHAKAQSGNKHYRYRMGYVVPTGPKDDTFLENLALFESKESWAEAVRWMFIKYLSQLEKHQMIVWQSGKTNLDYSKELSNIQIKQVYNTLMKGYNDAWFGHHLTDHFIP